MTAHGSVRFAEGQIQVGKRFAVSLQRTLRVPEDGREYPLPPGFGRFPMAVIAGAAADLDRRVAVL